MTVRFLTFTDCFNKFISLQCRVDDSSFIWIHRLKYNRFSGLFHLVGNSSCKVFQSLFTTSSVILCIKFDTDIIGFAFIYKEELKDADGAFVYMTYMAQYEKKVTEIALFGKIVRTMPLDDGRFLYGCALMKKNEMIGHYINQKQMEQLAKKNERLKK